MRLSMIVACDPNGVIGVNGKLPWHIPEDLKRFKELTMGHPVIMGRRTFESIGKPLPGRVNIVISQSPSFVFGPNHGGIMITPDLENAIKYAKYVDSEECFIIGGQKVYEEAVTMVDRVYLTGVKEVFPPYSRHASVRRVQVPDIDMWNIVESKDYHDHHFYVLDRKPIEQPYPVNLDLPFVERYTNQYRPGCDSEEHF